MDKLAFDASMPKKFERDIKYVQGLPNVRLVSPDELEDMFSRGVFEKNRSNGKPSVAFRNPVDVVHYFYATAWRIRSFNKKARAFLFISMITVVVLGIVLVRLFG